KWRIGRGGTGGRDSRRVRHRGRAGECQYGRWRGGARQDGERVILNDIAILNGEVAVPQAPTYGVVARSEGAQVEVARDYIGAGVDKHHSVVNRVTGVVEGARGSYACSQGQLAD